MNRRCQCSGLGAINPCDDFVSGEIGTQFGANMIQAEYAEVARVEIARREKAADMLKKVAPIALALLMKG